MEYQKFRNVFIIEIYQFIGQFIGIIKTAFIGDKL